MYNIIIFNMSPYSDWQRGIVNRNFFVLNNLVKRSEINKIVSVDFLPIRGKSPFGLKRVIKYIMESLLNKVDGEIISKNITSKCFKKDKIYYYSSIDLYLSEKFFFKKIKKLLNKINFYEKDKKTIILSYNPIWIKYFNKINCDLKIFDAVDNWSVHASYKNYKDKLLNNYQIINKESDIIFVVAKDLLNLFQGHENVHWVPNGVDLSHFQNRINSQEFSFKKPVIGYVGTIQNRVDIDLIAYIAKNHPDKTIVIGGPIWQDVLPEVENKLKFLKNVRLLGRINYNGLPGLINKFDVCIIPHKIDQFIKSTNPMKMYDYLICGKPIVTTRGAGVEMFGDLIYIADSYEDFNMKILKALNEEQILKINRQEAVKNHSWTNRITEMIDIINQFS